MFRKRLVSYILVSLFLCSCLLSGFSPINAEENDDEKLVYIIPVENEVEKGLNSFLKRTTNEAEKAGADHIIFEIDTPGGAVDAAGQIATLIQDLDTPTTAYIVNQALSAGSYIALNMDSIYMQPHATMGASGVINEDGAAADKKAQSAWISAMKGAAESKDRDPKYAEAMADPDIDLPDYGAPKGKFLTLDASAAIDVGYSDGKPNSRNELLQELGLEDAEVVEDKPTFSEELARFLTNPVVVPILLSVASLGLIVELYSPGFGVPGTMGLISLFLFFYGHIIAGLAGYEVVFLLILGITLIVVEFFISGGIAGLLGVASIVGSMFLSGQDVGHMAMSISIALIITIIVSVILFKTVGKQKGLLKHVILSDQTSTDKGYISSANREELLDLEGKTVTPLRPSGAALLAEERLDVISEGAYIPAGETVKVVHVEGARIVVRRKET